MNNYPNINNYKNNERLVEMAIIFGEYIGFNGIEFNSVEDEIPVFERSIAMWESDRFLQYNYYGEFLNGEWDNIVKDNKKDVMRQLENYASALKNNFTIELANNPNVTFEDLLVKCNPIIDDDDYMVMEVYLDTIIPDFEADTNVAEIKVKRSVLEQYYKEEIKPAIDCFDTFDGFYNEYDCDCVEDLYEYAEKHSGLEHNYKADYWANRCELYDNGLTCVFRYKR